MKERKKERKKDKNVRIEIKEIKYRKYEVKERNRKKKKIKNVRKKLEAKCKTKERKKVGKG